MTSSSKPLFRSRISTSAWIVIVSCLVFFVVSFLGRNWIAKKMDEQLVAHQQKINQSHELPQRLIGLAPSNVETLFAMGLGDHVVGVSRFTSYPPEALDLPKVGGYVDVDLERLVSLRPDCIVMVESQRALIPKFDELGVKHVSVDHASVEGIVKSFHQIAEVCGNKKEAEAITKKMRQRIAEVKARVKPGRRPRVLVCIHHEIDSSQPTQVVVAGNAGFHQDLIKIAGGVNAYQGPVAFPKLSRENLINVNPDIMIILLRDEVLKTHTKQELIDQWRVYQELNAVKNNHVFILVGKEHFVPGPRTLQTLDAFAEIIRGASL